VSFVALRPDPFALAHESNIHVPTGEPTTPVREILLRPAVFAAIAALVAGQATMVLIMTMTPLHLTAHNHGLEIVGLVISGHVAGMYALAPLSGWITQRIGQLQTIFLGTGVLVVAALLAALAPPERDEVLFVALFLLGWGWNLGFVAGSAMLSSSVELEQRTRVQGVADAVIWTTSAVASLGSGVIVAAAGFSALGILGVAVVLAPVWLLLNRRAAIAAAAAS
jgi:MFS family permease